MSCFIKDVYETRNNILLKEREKQIINNTYDLGPNDLVEITKQEKSFIFPSTPKGFFHEISGVKMDTPASFSAYFANLLSRQEKYGFSRRYIITKGSCYVFDSFNKKDICFTTHNNGDTTVKYVNYNIDDFSNITTTFEDLDDDRVWTHIRYSSILRYYRASTNILYSFFGSKHMLDTPLRQFFPETLIYEDFEYIVNNHSLTDELQSALSAASLVSLSFTEIEKFFKDNVSKLQRFLFHIFRYVPITSGLAKKLVPLLRYHIDYYQDDYDIVGKLVLLDDSGIDVNILLNSMWCSPTSAIVMAKREIKRKNYENAFHYLNIAAYAKNWPQYSYSYRDIEVIKPRKAPENNPTSFQSKLFNNPLSSIQTDYLATITDLCYQMGFDEFKELVNNYSNGRRTGRIFTNNRIWPCDISINPYVDDDLFLYDPGIEAGSSIPKLYLNFDFSQSFQDCIREFFDYHQKRQSIILGKSYKTDLSTALYSALRFNDKDLLVFCVELIRQKKKATMTDIMMLYIANMRGMGPELSDIISFETNRANVIEMNSIDFVKNIALCLEELSQ